MLTEIEKPFREYASHDQIPLAGYAGSLLTFAAGLATALTVTRKKRWQPGVMDVAMLGVATHKLSRIVSKDFVTAPLRAPFTRRQAAEGAGEVHDEPRGGSELQSTIGYLLTCPYCLGPWIATGLGTALLLRPVQTRFVLRMLASVTVSDFLHLAYSRLNESRKTVLAERRLAEAGSDKKRPAARAAFD